MTTKQYLRYAPKGNCNIITSARCNVIFLTLQGQIGRFVAVGACEHVYIWDLSLSEKTQVLTGEKHDVTYLCASPNQRHIAVGYADGTVKIFDLRSAEEVSSFVGHYSEITALAFDSLGHVLASGSKDTDIIVWDVVAEIGKCRLTGHKGVITKLAFMSDHNILISSSKDTFVKFWDLSIEHNFKTLVGHRSEVWGFILVKNDKYLITGCNDNELHVWKIVFVDEDNINIESELAELNISDDLEVEDVKHPLRCNKIGGITRTGKGRVVSLEVDATDRVFGCHGVDNTIELFYLETDEKVEENMAKRLKKERKKAAKKENNDEESIVIKKTVCLTDEIKRLSQFQVSAKAKALNLIMGRSFELRICVGVNNNSIELHSLNVEEKNAEVKSLRKIVGPGHRTDVRAVCFSSDNLAFATASGDSVKLWSRSSLACIQTVQCGYVLTLTFVPGDRHLIAGLKDGKMIIIDIANGDVLEEIPAHDKELWSIVLIPDTKQGGVVSGGEDHHVKFWEFVLTEDPDTERKAKILSLLHTKTLKLEESVLCVRISPNKKFIAVALLDCTVKIFFFDTLKFFVSLYGHSLPVRSMDISSDSTLIATGSADKNMKIWGMDFGDCHKSIFAHDGTVTGVSFVPKTHYIFTCGKDGKVKQWDADIFQKVITLEGHSGEAQSCAVSNNGVYVISCGSDKVVRLYEKTLEPLVLQDENEEERAKEENELVTEEITTVLGQKQQIRPSRKTVNAEIGADLISECLTVSKAYNEEVSRVVPPNPLPPLPKEMQAYNCKTTDEYLLAMVKRVRASELEETLLLLTYAEACEILHLIPVLLKKCWDPELPVRLGLCLLKAHYNPIITNSDLLPIIEEIQTLSVQKVEKMRDMVGINLYGLRSAQRSFENEDGIELFKDATKTRKHKNDVRRNKQRALKRAIMQL